MGAQLTMKIDSSKQLLSKYDPKFLIFPPPLYDKRQTRIRQVRALLIEHLVNLV